MKMMSKSKFNETLSQRHEREFAEVIPGGTGTIASGAKLEKHDVRTNQSEESRFWQFRYELKCTQKKGYRLTKEEWKKLKQYVYSRTSDERPAWAIRFYSEEDKDRTSDVIIEEDLVVVSLDDWVELLEELRQYRSWKEVVRDDTI